MQKLLIEQFFGEKVKNEAWCYDRFIYKHTLFHSNICKSLTKRINCITKTKDEKFISIIGLLRIENRRGTISYIVLAFILEEVNEILIKHDNFSSTVFSTIVQKTENVHIIVPDMIGKKCICIPYGAEKFA